MGLVLVNKNIVIGFIECSSNYENIRLDNAIPFLKKTDNVVSIYLTARCGCVSLYTKRICEYVCVCFYDLSRCCMSVCVSILVCVEFFCAWLPRFGSWSGARLQIIRISNLNF